MLFCTVFLLVCATILLWSFWCYKFTYWSRRGVAHIPPTFPFGNIRQVGRTLHSAELMKSVYEKFKGSGHPFVGIFYFTRPVAVVTNLNLVRDILVRNFVQFNDRGVYSNPVDDPLSTHLFSLEGEKWREIRRTVAPLFSPARIKTFHESIWEVASRLSLCIGTKTFQGKTLNVSDLAARYVIDAIGHCVFGINPSALDDDSAPLHTISQKIFTLTPLQMLRHLFMQSFGSIARKFHMKLTKNEVTDFFFSLHRTQLGSSSDCTQPNCFMKLLNILQKDGKLSDNQVIAQAFIFFVAGFETSAITIAYCLYELAWNQSIQERLRNEVVENMEENGTLSWDAINRMTLLSAVVNETLRKYPPGGNFLRVAREDVKVDERVIESGTLVVIPLYGIHRDGDIYENPLDFNPDRPELTHHSCTFMPFGDGPRHCIGRRFALHQIKLAISVLLCHRRFSPAPGTIHTVELAKNTVLLAPRQPLRLNVENLTLLRH
ncbi:cytochrome P450 6a22-like [Lutzomyia longipalpis]|uniref:cytochrome P450 6a22-like n=1 Tax=Lutzomyia longipalpis TaxID=7200 RepID=UPI0024832F6C|nr:cytochrome P450 6a22-like [Lutzomyia longipalpis]